MVFFFCHNLICIKNHYDWMIVNVELVMVYKYIPEAKNKNSSLPMKKNPLIG